LQSRFHTLGYEECNKLLRDKLGTPAQLLTEVIDLYSSKPLCYFDIKTYLPLLNTVDEKRELLSHIDLLPASAPTTWAGILRARVELAVGSVDTESSERIARLWDQLNQFEPAAGQEAGIIALVIVSYLWREPSGRGECPVTLAPSL